MSRIHRTAATVLSGALLAAACGGGGDSAEAQREQTDPAAVVAAATDEPITPASAETETVDDEEAVLDPTLIRGEIINQFTLELGECFNRIETLRAGRKVTITTRLPCEDLHQFEVFHTFEVEAPHPAIFPGDDVMENFALQSCYLEFDSFVGEIYELSEYDIGVFTPNRTNFEDDRARYRGITCWLHRDDMAETEGSAEGREI